MQGLEPIRMTGIQDAVATQAWAAGLASMSVFNVIPETRPNQEVLLCLLVQQDFHDISFMTGHQCQGLLEYTCRN